MQEFILVVNDTAIQRKLFRQLLGLQGFRVMTAESKEAALAVLQEEKPLLIVMDVHLGEMDGLELTRELRAHCWAEGIPILLVSSLYKHLTKTEAQTVGARDFLQLPEELVGQLASGLQTEGNSERLKGNSERGESGRWEGQ
jgi:PleD family two-component response regulator